jgi:esterase/lipase superfamily enzyme
MDFLSVRVSDVGGRVADRVNPPSFSLAHPRLVILVHGFNVSRKSGQDSYLAFGNLLEKQGLRTLSVLGQVVGFCWPGDVNLGIFSGLFYPTEMAPARSSAALLSNFLLRLRGPQGTPIQVVLVAHSLGNRLALELIQKILDQTNRSWGRIEGLCLMAAAVPVSMVQDIRRLGRAAQATRTQTFFSKDDTVLQWAFPLGEAAAGEGWFPQAVGRFGNPVTMWTRSYDLQPYNHGHYFPGKGTDDRSARYIAQFLGAAVPTEPSITQPSMHALPTPNGITTHHIGAP